jgi:hypothetical protein
VGRRFDPDRAHLNLFVLGAPSGNLATLEDALIALNFGLTLVDDLVNKG